MNNAYYYDFYRDFSGIVQVQNNYNTCKYEVQQLLKRVDQSKCIWLGFRLNRSMIHPAPIQTICFWLNGKLYGFRDFTTHSQSPHITNTRAFSAIEIHRPCLPNIIPAAFTLNLTSTQSFCKGHAIGAVVLILAFNWWIRQIQLCWGAGRKSQTEIPWGERSSL